MVVDKTAAHTIPAESATLATPIENSRWTAGVWREGGREGGREGSGWEEEKEGGRKEEGT